MNFSISVLKTGKLSAFLMSGFNLFHSMILDEKGEFLGFFFRRGMFTAFLVDY